MASNAHPVSHVALLDLAVAAVAKLEVALPRVGPCHPWRKRLGDPVSHCDIAVTFALCTDLSTESTLTGYSVPVLLPSSLLLNYRFWIMTAVSSTILKQRNTFNSNSLVKPLK